MILFSLLVSTSFTVGVVIASTLDPAPLTFLRFAFAAIIFAAFVLVSGRWRWPSFTESWQSLVLGALVSVYFVAMFEALRLTDALNTGALFCTIPLMTAVVAYAWLGQALRGRQLISLVLAGAGALWVIFDGSLVQLLAFQLGSGELVFLLGCLAYSAYSPAIRWFDAGVSALLISFWTVVAGLLWIGLYGIGPMLATDWSRVPVSTLIAIAYLALFTTVISFFLIQFASTRLPQARVMAYIYLVPVFIVLTEGIAYGTWPGPSVLAGVGVITAAMLVLQVEQRGVG